MNLKETGLNMFFNPYQIASLESAWESKKPLSTLQVWKQVNEKLLPRTISRASIINFLNASVDNGLLDFVESTGKGGYRRLYSAKFTKSEASTFLAERVRERLQTL